MSTENKDLGVAPAEPVAGPIAPPLRSGPSDQGANVPNAPPHRPLKFRAWDGEQMHYDVALTYRGYAALMIEGNPGGCADPECCSQMPDETLGVMAFAPMQFTGLSDCDGTEIWEGDILQRGDPLPMTGRPSNHIPFAKHRVYYHEGAFRLRRGLHSKNFILRSSLIRFNGLRVVGNVYEAGWMDTGARVSDRSGTPQPVSGEEYSEERGPKGDAQTIT